MNDDNWKRVTVLLLALLFTCLYVESHVNNDFKMVKLIGKQKNEIEVLKSYIKVLERGNSGKWKRCS
tara:strand:+ start:222 stop:422 length:201 start_codon:yes stop_codon:yes gene_type:complete